MGSEMCIRDREGPVETVFRGEWDFWLGNLDGLPSLLDVKT